jgi:hypothetical protein
MSQPYEPQWPVMEISLLYLFTASDLYAVDHFNSSGSNSIGTSCNAGATVDQSNLPDMMEGV